MRGLDNFRDRELARYHDEQERQEAWEERVEERAEELVNEEPDMVWAHALGIAEEQLEREDKEAAEAEAERQAEKMIGEREAMDDWFAGRMP